MSAVDDEKFNSVFISYSSKDKEFAQKFRDELQDKLGNSIHVWMANDLPEGKAWRREIQRRLNSTALVVLILSPNSIKSPWVLYEWHYSLLVQQSEPFLVYFLKCDDDDLNRFTDYQLPDALAEDDAQAKVVWTGKKPEIDKTLDTIAKRLHGFSKLQEYYKTLTNTDGDEKDQRKAAYNLGNVPEDLKLAAANYLIEALQFWLSYGVYGPVGASIANALGRLGKRKATPTLVQFFLDQADYRPALNSVQRALSLLSSEEPL